MKSGNTGGHAERMRCKGELSSQHLRVVFLHSFHDPGLQNGGAGEVSNKVRWLLPSPDSLLIADPRMGGIIVQGTRCPGNNGKINVEGEPADIAGREIR